MNNAMMDLLLLLYEESYTTQRDLAKKIGISTGLVNKGLAKLKNDGYLTKQYQLTDKSHQIIKENQPSNAIILAAGYGIRMIPLNNDFPKGLIEISGQTLIERLILQLQEKGIQDITIIVCFMKEKYDFLIDKYGVKLRVNPDYSSKNNLSSIDLVRDSISNTYILPCDVWFSENPFHTQELYSWYTVKDGMDIESNVRKNRQNELLPVSKNGNKMIGIAYFNQKDANILRQNIKILSQNPEHDNSFWETAFFINDQDKQIKLYAKTIPENSSLEINTFEDLRSIDDNSKQLENKAISLIKDKMNVTMNEIDQVITLKKGMTNRSFLFSVNNTNYIMRIPGEGTDQLINRKEEAEVYNIISSKGISDDIIYIDPKIGYKITRFIDNSRCCDPNDEEDLKKCMRVLKSFHDLNLKVDHTFDIFEKINYYESLWGDYQSAYPDYQETKDHVMQLIPFIDKYKLPYSLTHIDAVPDNFLIAKENGKEIIRLIDWEYSGMQDSHVDIAMFSIYSLYSKEEIDRLIDIYFEDNCDISIRTKIYAYISACGLLWSNWCEYKSQLGIEFGEYSLRQYRYAKDYSRLVQEMVKQYDL